MAWVSNGKKAKPVPLHVWLREQGETRDSELCRQGRLSPEVLKMAKWARSQAAGAQTSSPFPEKKRCYECGALGHIRRECPRLNSGGHPAKGQLTCGNCGKPVPGADGKCGVCGYVKPSPTTDVQMSVDTTQGANSSPDAKTDPKAERKRRLARLTAMRDSLMAAGDDAPPGALAKVRKDLEELEEASSDARQIWNRCRNQCEVAQKTLTARTAELEAAQQALKEATERKSIAEAVLRDRQAEEKAALKTLNDAAGPTVPALPPAPQDPTLPALQECTRALLAGLEGMKELPVAMTDAIAAAKRVVAPSNQESPAAGTGDAAGAAAAGEPVTPSSEADVAMIAAMKAIREAPDDCGDAELAALARKAKHARRGGPYS